MTFLPVNTLSVPLDENVSFSIDTVKFNEQITRRYRDIARECNSKDKGFYIAQETLNFQKWYDLTDPQKFHQIFRLVVDTGALPNAAFTQTAHGLQAMNDLWMMTRIYGTAIDPTIVTNPIFIPLPNGGPNYEVELSVDNTYVYVTTSVDLTAFTQSFVVLEYWKI